MLFFLIQVGAIGQSLPIDLRFDHLTVNNGLSHSDAMTVIEDEEGFVWIGTNKGVDRFDGSRIKNYSFNMNAPSGLASNRIRSMYVSASNELWIGTENGGLSYYDRPKDRFIHINETIVSKVYQPVMRILAKSHVTTIAQDGLGNIWVGTEEEGIFIIERDKENFASVKRLALDEHNLIKFGVRSIKVGTKGEMIIATFVHGLYYVHKLPGSQKYSGLTKIDFEVKHIQAVYLDAKGGLWVGADSRIYYVSQPTLPELLTAKPIQVTSSLPGIECLHLDTFGKLWIGTGNGIYLVYPEKNLDGLQAYQKGQIQQILPQEGVTTSLSYSKIQQIFEDKSQVIWIAANAGGINKVNLLAKQFGQLQPQVSPGILFTSNYINSIFKEEDKHLIWMGTRNGISAYDPVSKTYQKYLNHKLGSNVNGLDVGNIFQDSKKTLWFGLRTDGFACLRRGKNEEKLLMFTINSDKKDFKTCGAISFVEDRQGYIWMATLEAGLYKFTKDGKQLANYQYGKNGLPTNKFNHLYYDSTTNIIWASTPDAGLLKLGINDGAIFLINQFKNKPHDSLSLSVNYVWPLLKDAAGNIWIGTIGGGLHQLVKDATGKEYITRWGKWLPEQDVESMVLDEEGNIWIGGGGLWRFNPKTKKYLKFEVADGLQSNSFKVGAAVKANDGTLYIGGINGITYFHPSTIQPNPYPPKVVITELSVFNKPVGIDEEINGRVLLRQNLRMTKEITILARENDFSLDFIAFHYANPGKVSYAYKLEGYHDNWVYPPLGQRTASFANLTSGNYTFLLKASNSDGLWSAKPAILHIRVLPPWWKTWWAYTLLGSFILGLLILSRKIAAAQQDLLNKLALEKLQHENDKKLNELKLRFFTNISHDLRTPLTLILGPMEELIGMSGKLLNGMSEKVFMMHKQTRKLLDLVNQLMDFRKAESDQIKLKAQEGDIIKFLYEIYLIFKPKAEEKNIRFTFHSSPDSILLYFDRGKLEIVITNLLSNAFKYTPTHRKIEIVVSLKGDLQKPGFVKKGKAPENYLQIEIKDWGVGINPEELDKIFDVYYQATHTETMHIHGTGIGLSLAKQIVERHGGEISVKSQMGEGTHFTLKLPLGNKHFSAEDLYFPTGVDEIKYPPLNNSLHPDILHKREDVAELGLLSTTKLLIVEDNADVLAYLNKIFESLLNVYTAVNGVEGWQKTMEILPDIVLSDIMMPLSDGLDLCRKIKSDPRTMHIPVVLLTARAAAIHELEGLETGADDYLIKPFNPRLLQSKILTLLLNRKKLQEYYQKQILMEPTKIVIPDADKYLLEEAMRIVENNLEQPDFNVHILARELAMSASGFYRKIKSITGLSPVEFIREVRMKRAAQLLQEGSLRISEIAFKVGMDDTKYFRKTFQKIFNMTPSEYAKMYTDKTVSL